MKKAETPITEEPNPFCVAVTVVDATPKPASPEEIPPEIEIIEETYHDNP